MPVSVDANQFSVNVPVAKDPLIGETNTGALGAVVSR